MNATQSRKLPKFRVHKATGQAYVELSGKRFYLGRHESPEARQKYHSMVAEWLAAGRQLRVDPEQLTIKELIARYWVHAEQYYRNADGSISSEVENIRLALRPVKELYALGKAAEFGPLALRAVRQKMIERGMCRSNINKQIGRIKRVFKWAASEELVPGHVHHALQSLAGLRRGRTEARESEPVRPVPEEHINTVQPFVGRQVWAMIQLQLHTAARAGEIAILRPCDVDMSGSIWVFTPVDHKTAHLGYERRIYLGPRAQAVLRPFLLRRTDACCFAPVETEAERRAEMHANRKTPLSCGNRPGTNRRDLPCRTPGERYSTPAYHRAIEYACDRAFPPPAPLARRPGECKEAWRNRLTAEQREELREWRPAHRFHPHQLRHNAATNLRRQFGLEAAQLALGHASAQITDAVYAERDYAKIAEIMRKIG